MGQFRSAVNKGPHHEASRRNLKNAVVNSLEPRDEVHCLQLNF